VGEIVIKEYEPVYREGCIALLEATFPGASDEHSFAYRFEGRTSAPLLVLALDGDRVVAFNSWIPWTFRFQGEQLTGFQSGESATDVRYRRRGIFGRILKFADRIVQERAVDFFFGFPGPMSCSIFFKSGYRPVSTLQYALCPLNPLRRGRKTMQQPAPSPEFTEYLLQKNRITPLFDREYFTWRYLNNPKQYDVVEYQENGCQALFVLRRKMWKCFPELLLLDWQATSYEQNFIGNAFSWLRRQYAGQAFFMRTYGAISSERGEILARHFRLGVRKGSDVFVVKPISDRVAHPVLYNRRRWDLMPHCVDEL